jgi:hypothetical protein
MSVNNPVLPEIRDEGISQGRALAINFTGAGVTAAVAGFVATVTIPGGGGGGASATTVEVNVSATPVFRGRFTLIDAAIGATSKVLMWQAPGPYTGKGTRADEAELAPVKITTINPTAGSAEVYWETPPIIGQLSFPNAQQSQTGATNVVTNPKDPQGYGRQYPVRIGKVRGNIKFSYVVFA